MRSSFTVASRIATRNSRLSLSLNKQRWVHSTASRYNQNASKSSVREDPVNKDQEGITVFPDGSFMIRYREGYRERLKNDIQKAMHSAKPQFNTAIRILNCYSKMDAQAISECFSDLGIEGVSGVNMSNGYYAILVPPPADKGHCKYVECKFLPDELGKPWGSEDQIHPGWPELHDGNWINWDGNIPFVKRHPTNSVSHFFQPFLSYAQRMRCFPYLVMDHTQPKTRSELQDDIRAFIRGSFFVIEDAFSVNMYFQPDKPTGTAMTTRWEFSVDALYKNFHELCGQKKFDDKNAGLLKATLTVLLFRIWFLLRQRNDVLSLLNCPTTDKALEGLINNFTSRYVPAQLCQLDDPVPLSAKDLYEFQDSAKSRKNLVLQDRQNLVRYLHKVVEDLRKRPDDIVKFFENTPMKSVIVGLLQMQDLDFEDEPHTHLEDHGEQIFETMTSLNKDEVEMLFDSVKPVVQSADGTPLAQI